MLLASALLLLGVRALAVPLVLSLVLVAASSLLFLAVGVVAVPPPLAHWPGGPAAGGRSPLDIGFQLFRKLQILMFYNVPSTFFSYFLKDVENVMFQ